MNIFLDYAKFHLNLLTISSERDVAITTCLRDVATVWNWLREEAKKRGIDGTIQTGNYMQRLSIAKLEVISLEKEEVV